MQVEQVDLDALEQIVRQAADDGELKKVSVRWLKAALGELSAGRAAKVTIAHLDLNPHVRRMTA